MSITESEIIKQLTELVNRLQGEKQCDLTFGDWLLQWYATYKEKKHKPISIKNNKSYIAKIIVGIGEVQLADLKGYHLQNFLNSVELDNTRSKLAMLINAALKKAVNEDLIDKNPYRSVEIKTHKPKHFKPLEFSQQNKILLKEYNPLYLNVFWVLCCTGLRIGEFVALNFDKDVDLRYMNISVNKSVDLITKKVQAPKTETSIRQVKFTKTLKPYLQYLREFQKSGGTLTYNKIRLHFDRVFKRFNIPGINLHSFRHTFVSLCYYVGMREKYIQQLVGHSTVDVTLNVYTHVLKKGTSPLLDYIRELHKTIR